MKFNFLCVLCAVSCSPFAFSSSLSVAPASAEQGTPVTLSWSVFGNYQSCSLNGLQTGNGNVGQTGSITFTPSKSLNISLSCFSMIDEGGGKFRPGNSLQESVIFNLEPTINISYPDSVFSGDYWELKIDTKNATSCELVRGLNGGTAPTQSMDPSGYKARHSYLNSGAPYTLIHGYHEVICKSDIGNLKTNRKKFTVVAKPNEVPVTPTITEFYVTREWQRGVNLRWKTQHMKRCDLTHSVNGATRNFFDIGTFTMQDFQIAFAHNTTNYLTLGCLGTDNKQYISNKLTVIRPPCHGITCGVSDDGRDPIGGGRDPIMRSSTPFDGNINGEVLSIDTNNPLSPIEIRKFTLDDNETSILLELNKMDDNLHVYATSNQGTSKYHGYELLYSIPFIYSLDIVRYVSFDDSQSELHERVKLHF